MNILIDIGNTRVKWCIEKNNQLDHGQAINYKEVEFITVLEQAWLHIDTPQKLAISSVSSTHIVHKICELALRQWAGIEIMLAKSTAQSANVNNAYDQPEKLGVDRWLALIALQYYYPGNSCVVDCGTAITIDGLNEDGQHLGGLISPGIQLMRQSLIQGTEALGCFEADFSCDLANSTAKAINSGILLAAAGLIEKAINDLLVVQTIVLTGGDAKLLANNIQLSAIIEEDFVLKGLSLYCKEACV